MTSSTQLVARANKMLDEDFSLCRRLALGILAQRSTQSIKWEKNFSYMLQCAKQVAEFESNVGHAKNNHDLADLVNDFLFSLSLVLEEVQAELDKK